MYYITQDVQAVADQLRDAYQREEIKREARVALVVSAPKRIDKRIGWNHVLTDYRKNRSPS